ncbi:MAG: RNA polymerase sigma factor RpoD/SigA [Verrucomicrobiaceae bacterium]
MNSFPENYPAYQERTSGISRPSREEETALIDRKWTSERAMLRILSGIGQAARHMMALGQRIAAGEERMNRWLRMRMLGGTSIEREAFQNRHDVARRLFDEQQRISAENPGTTPPEALRAALAGLCFKLRVLEDALEELLRLEQRTWGEMSVEEQHKLECEAWMPLADFRQHVQLAARHHQEALDAKWRLVKSHLWMVPMIARNFSCRFLSFMDLVQEGNLGLIRAAEVCGEDFDCRFSSYAGWWIRQGITRAVEDQELLIRVPSYVSGTAARLYRIRQSLEQAAGREVEDDEVAWHAGMPLSRARRVLDSYRAPMSLHEVISSDGDGSELGELIADEQSAAADELASRRDNTSIVQEALSVLNAQEREVLSLRFGLQDGDLRTMEEIGRAAALTKQRIQQIESRAMAKLRHPARLRHLARWL